MANPVYLNGTSGNDILNVDSSATYFVNAGAGDDLIKINLTTNVGGTYVGYANSYIGGSGNDTIEITGSNSWAAFQTFTPSNGIETIKGDGAGDAIVAGYNTATNKAFGTLDLSGTTLVNISQIRGTSADDDITGSKGADIINTGDGNDTIRESGGSDVIDGGTGTNSFIAQSASTTYVADLGSPGSASFNSGTSWKFTDSSGATITLKNIQSVVFTDGTLYSTSNNPQGSTGMTFIAASGNPAPNSSKSMNISPQVLPAASMLNLDAGTMLKTGALAALQTMPSYSAYSAQDFTSQSGPALQTLGIDQTPHSFLHSIAQL